MSSFELPTSAAHLYANTPIPYSTCSTTITQIFLKTQKPIKPSLTKSFSCRAAKDSTNYKDQEDKNVEGGRFDRRDILLGLGGLYGTTAVNLQAAVAAPVGAQNCGVPETLPSGANAPKFVCPPALPEDYKLPEYIKVRTRPAAQSANPKHMEAYEAALRHMRSLPREDPHSLAAQAAIHCAYCDSAYEMVGFPGKKMQVHNNWLFFPFHRWYMYFYESIVRKYAKEYAKDKKYAEEDFALPYWNWDLKEGMEIPAMFANRDSPLYDKLRNDAHYNHLKVDLHGVKPSPVGEELIQSNYNIMYNQMVSSSKIPESFFGKTYRAGDKNEDKGEGAIERGVHTQVHIWTGDPTQRYGEDMGRFYSAGRDPIFYAHHGNVDRMWYLRKNILGDKDITDPDWMDSTFLFYDDNKKLVRVKVGDCVDTKRLGYEYQPKEIPWRLYKYSKPQGGSDMAGVAKAAEMPNNSTTTSQVFPKASEEFPKVFEDLIKVTVPRPKKSRSIKEKKEKEEILVIYGIEFDGDEYINFDVFLNSENEVASGPNNAEFAGSYSNVPFKDNEKVKVSMQLGISELLEKVKSPLGASGSSSLLVTKSIYELRTNLATCICMQVATACMFDQLIINCK